MFKTRTFKRAELTPAIEVARGPLNRSQQTTLIGFAIVLAVVTLGLDLMLPLGVAVGVGYVALVLISLWLPGRTSTYGAAATGSALNLVGMAVSDPGGIAWMAFANRAVALVVIWATAVIVLQRKRTQDELLRLGRRLGERILRAAPQLVYVYDLSQERLAYANPETLRCLNCSEDAIASWRFEGWAIHAEDRSSVERQMARLRLLADDEVISLECRLCPPDGSFRWFTARHVVFSRDSAGGVREALGVAEDVTDREAAREALSASESELRALAMRLISFQEEERKRVAREIHDNVSQHMAAVAIQTSRLRNDLPSDRAEIVAKLQLLGREIGSVSDELHRVSHQLHPSVLENLGLEATLEAECAAFAEREGLPVSFEAGRIPEELRPEIALALYRIVQESLHNIARHADASRIIVSLRLSGDAILLSVKDDGRGFRFEEAKRRGGVGLISMQERTRLIGASLDLIAAPGAGAEVRVLAPLLQDK